MKVVGISDIHGYLPELPKCDVVCICGDIIPLRIQKDFKESWEWLVNDFTKWCEDLDCNHVIFIAGNHDFVFDKTYSSGFDVGSIWKEHEKIHYLIDDSIKIGDKIFYGSPWCPNLKNWAFYLDSVMLFDKFNQIKNCDVLLTHCPPKIEQVGVVLQNGWNNGRDFGCEELRLALYDKNINWILSGHIHSGDHSVTKYYMNNSYINIVNVSIKDEDYKNIYKPFEFEI